jgi:hypothetical protein
MAYGFRPTQMAGSAYQTGGFVEVPINAANEAVDIFNGGVVTYTGGAGIDKLVDPVASSATTAGVLVGARWVTASGDQKWGQFYDGATGNTEAYAFVVPARGVIFRVKGNAAYTAAQAGTIMNTSGVAGSVTTGNSDLVVTNTAAGSSPSITIVGILSDGENDSSTTPDILVRFLAASIQEVLG